MQWKTRSCDALFSNFVASLDLGQNRHCLFVSGPAHVLFQEMQRKTGTCDALLSNFAASLDISGDGQPGRLDIFPGRGERPGRHRFYQRLAIQSAWYCSQQKRPIRSAWYCFQQKWATRSLSLSAKTSNPVALISSRNKQLSHFRFPEEVSNLVAFDSQQKWAARSLSTLGKGKRPVRSRPPTEVSDRVALDSAHRNATKPLLPKHTWHLYLHISLHFLQNRLGRVSS